jgi:hypothetical protein
VKIFKIPDDTYDFVNAYPEAILDKVGKEMEDK